MQKYWVRDQLLPVGKVRFLRVVEGQFWLLEGDKLVLKLYGGGEIEVQTFAYKTRKSLRLHAAKNTWKGKRWKVLAS